MNVMGFNMIVGTPYIEYHNTHLSHYTFHFVFILNTNEGKYLFALNACDVIQYDCWYSLQ